MEDESAFGMTNQRIYDETDYSVDPKLKKIEPKEDEEEY